MFRSLKLEYIQLQNDTFRKCTLRIRDFSMHVTLFFEEIVPLIWIQGE